MSDVQVQKIDELKTNFKGEIVLPGDSAYEQTRKIWNAMIDKHPSIIARCATTQDVVQGVNFARNNKLLLAVRGGGHNIAGSAICDDGIVIDLSRMKAASLTHGVSLLKAAPRSPTWTPPLKHMAWPRR